MTSRAHSHLHRGFTLAEVLAALLLMAIIVPVALQGVQIASRAGTLGQRKAAAMRVAERVLNELLATDGLTQSTGSGTVAEGDQSYAWTMQTETWPEDAMNVVTVRVVFNVQGYDYNVSLSSLYDPTTVSLTGSQSP
ncbi:MAG TPA: prepilin-type N-terminal cleavage/methylation domain-containing protein [Opitutaceae bacterium]|nr:prepilin-type N-terminal cleavage/methylation domain-containing protein [Opitutaceae bacterium]